MSIYHFSAKTFSKRNSACAIAKAAYRSGQDLYDVAQNRHFDYQHRENVLYSNIIIPENCPDEYKDRETLWNSVEAQKTNSNARFAREFEVALPNEWTLEEAAERVEEFARNSLVDRGMICDINIHQNHSQNNLHAHIMAPSDPVNEEGQFSGVDRKVFANCQIAEIDEEEMQRAKVILDNTDLHYSEYCKNQIEIPAEKINNGEWEKAKALLKQENIEIKNIRASYDDRLPGFDAKNKEDTEKHRLKAIDDNGEAKKRTVIRNGKEYSTQQYIRTKVDQNPWDTKEQLLEWRKEWADHCNRYLDRDQQIDHRSYIDQGIDRIPTIHEGVQAKELEQKGITSELIDVNRNIRQYNNLWDKLKDQIENLKFAVNMKLEEARESIETIKLRIQELRRPDIRTQYDEKTAAGQEQSDRSNNNADRDRSITGSDDSRTAELFARARAALGQSIEQADKEVDIYERARAALNGANRATRSQELTDKPDVGTAKAKQAVIERSQRDDNRAVRERSAAERSREDQGRSR